MLETASSPPIHSPLPSTPTTPKLCGGCQKSVESDSGGIVVAFGQALWHVDCFKCAKCGNRVTADTNLLLLSDGSPVCGSCSYNCSICKLPILDEAIMTGDESYHAACFTCKSCARRIDELVFAKTSQGIYCMTCHNERVARSRRHAEKKKKQQKAKREEEERHRGDQNSGLAGPTDHNSPTSASYTTMDTPTETPRTQESVQGRPVKRFSIQQMPSNFEASAPRLVPSISVPPSISEQSSEGQLARYPSHHHTIQLSLPSSSEGPSNRGAASNGRGSISASQAESTSSGLSIPEATSRQAKRRSINPGMWNLDLNAGSVESPVVSLSHPSINGSYRSPSPSSLHPIKDGSPLPSRKSSLHSIYSPSESDRGRTRASSTSQSPSQDNLSNSDIPSSLDPSTKRSRSNTPIPSNVYSNGRTSDDSDPGSGLAPPTNENGIKRGQERIVDKSQELPPIELSFHDSVFSDFLSFVDGEGSKLTLKDPAASRRSMQALANVAEMISEESPVSGTQSPSELITEPEPMTTVPEEEETPLQPQSSKMSLEVVPEKPEDPQTPRSRSSSDSRTYANSASVHTRQNSSVSSSHQRGDSSASYSLGTPTPTRNGSMRVDAAELVTRRLKEALNDATERGANAVKLDRVFVETIIRSLQGGREKYSDLKGRLDNMKRVSQRMFDGLSVAQSEYDQELAGRRDAEAEITRLRLQLSTQSAQITSLTADHRRRELMEKMSKDMSENLHGLERDVSKLKAERDLTLAELEQLSKRSMDVTEPARVSRLTTQFEGIKDKYRRDLEPLIAEREALEREISELRQAKELCLEETTALTSRNDELLELNVAMSRQYETLQSALKPRLPERTKSTKMGTGSLPSLAPGSASIYSVSSTSTIIDDREEARVAKATRSDADGGPLRKFPWFKGKESGGREMSPTITRAQPNVFQQQPKPVIRHHFQQQNVLRFARCDHCGDKMWGTQYRCSNCSIACHTRCLNNLQTPCREMNGRDDKDVVEIVQLPPSMFGRDLIEQARADARGTDRMVPVIVEKCIIAVETLAVDYEGIYRKTGGASQSKAITQLFERGNYDAFDLTDIDSFNDISSVTSVLKSYFRSLPNPLLTFELHEGFVQAASYRDASAKAKGLMSLLDRLPDEHFETLRMLMLHLHRIMQHSDVNLMTARNLGVVFGPTLMRSADSAKEFADMAGKALCIEWLIENVPIWAQIDG